MDAAALPTTPLPPTGYETANANAPARRDADDDFAQHLPADATDRPQPNRASAKAQAKDDDSKDDDDTKEPAPPPVYALSSPVAPVIVRTDGAPSTQTVSLEGVVGASGGPAAAASGENAGANGAAPAAAAESGAETSAGPKQADAHKDAKAAKASSARAGAAQDKAPNEVQSAATANRNDKAADATPRVAQIEASAQKAAGGAPKDAGRATEPPPPPALSEVSAAAGDARRLTESQPSVVHRPPTLAATVAQNVIRRFNGDSTSIELQLHPAELGKVHVKLDVGADSRVTAVVAADNPSTLSDLMRSSRELERALESAGLELTSGGLSFDLSQNSADARGGDTAPASRDAPPAFAEPANDSRAQTAPAPRPFGLDTWRGVRVDMTV